MPVSVPSIVQRLGAHGVDLPEGRVRIDRYGDSEALSRELLALIRGGIKRAGTSLLWAVDHDGGLIPSRDDIEVVLDHRDEPALITRITSVEIVAFADVTEEYAVLEGEGDGSLEHWRRAHGEFFARECARVGRLPEDDMPVVCVTFELLWVLPAP